MKIYLLWRQWGCQPADDALVGVVATLDEAKAMAKVEWVEYTSGPLDTARYWVAGTYRIEEHEVAGPTVGASARASDFQTVLNVAECHEGWPRDIYLRAEMMEGRLRAIATLARKKISELGA